ncbi:hypothetical protein ACJ73_04248 [Blastomyces percursus]|uniref:Uncharacterized protein n=1 Tax=Blastomyces percursus TaxID=1658174 RepID=A0A1J9Q7E1_9EURO|nr:hypothetical protein ACJ73_04248 [Blastomyces percursus]
MGSFIATRDVVDGNLTFRNVTMSKSTTTFNGRESPTVRIAHHSTARAVMTVTTSSVSPIASISGNTSVVPTAHNFSFRGTPIATRLLSSHRLSAGIAVIPSQPSPADPALSSSSQGVTQISTTPTLTGVNMSAHNSMELPEHNFNPLEMGAIIGGSVSVTTIILIAIAVFLVLRRRRRKQCLMERTTRLSSEKKGKIGKSSRISPSGPARSSRYPTRAIDSHMRSVSTHFEQRNITPHPTSSPFSAMKSHTVRHFGKSSLPSHSSQLRDNEWHSIPSPNIPELVTRNSRRITSTDFPDPFLDPPRDFYPEISLWRPTTSPCAFHQNPSNTARRPMSIPSILDTNGGIQNLMPSQPSPVPLSICFRQPDVRALFPPQRNDSAASQIESNSASSGSVIVLPGRTSEASSGIFHASASDISYWRSNRSPQQIGLDTRRSDPFDLDRPDSSPVEGAPTPEPPDIWNQRLSLPRCRCVPHD